MSENRTFGPPPRKNRLGDPPTAPTAPVTVTDQPEIPHTSRETASEAQQAVAPPDLPQTPAQAGRTAPVARKTRSSTGRGGEGAPIGSIRDLNFKVDEAFFLRFGRAKAATDKSKVKILQEAFDLWLAKQPAEIRQFIR